MHHVLVSIPIQPDGRVLMRDLRDFIEATDDQPELAHVEVLPGEIRYEEES
jgi:hypothetical protein